jgi:tripartite-type tricarboxylate transporter receptor subunit TctC
MSFPVLSAAQGHVQAGKLRALGVTGPKRSALMPNVPTIAEAGLPNYSFETWFMVFAPAATPKPVIEKLNATLTAVLQSPVVKERLAKEGFEALTSTPAQARTRLETEMPKWAKLVKERGISAE